MDKLKMLREKKGGMKMHPMAQKAKLGVLDDLENTADEMMGGKLKGMKKVTVASDDSSGLEDGLDKAKNLLSKMPMDDSNPDHHEDEGAEAADDGEDGMSGESESEEDQTGLEAPEHHDDMPMDQRPEDMSDEELDQHIMHLMKLKQMKKGMA